MWEKLRQYVKSNVIQREEKIFKNKEYHDRV